MSAQNFTDALSTESTLKKFINTTEFTDLVKGHFSVGRVPYTHVFKNTDGGEVRFKFVDTVKIIRNSKNQEVPGKESFLSYLEISAHPVGAKGYLFSQDVLQLVWANGKAKQTALHAGAVQKLRDRATSLGIDLGTPGAWCTYYSENY